MEFIKFNSSLYKLQQHQELQKRYWLMHKRRIVVLSLSIHANWASWSDGRSIVLLFHFHKRTKGPESVF